MPRFIPVYSSSDAVKENVIKGGSDAFRIDKAEICKVLEKLRENYNLNLDDCPRDILDQIAILKDYARRLHGTEAYPAFYKLILKYFNDIGAPRPGTVAAICCGANYTEGMQKGEEECAITAINSILHPKMKKLPETNTIAIWDQDGIYETKIFANDKESKICYVFLLDRIPCDDTEIINSLLQVKQTEFEKARIYRYLSNGTFNFEKELDFEKLGYVDKGKEKENRSNRLKDGLKGGFKSRNCKRRNLSNYRNYIWVIFVILLILIIGIIFAAVLASSHRKRR